MSYQGDISESKDRLLELGIDVNTLPILAFPSSFPTDFHRKPQFSGHKIFFQNRNTIYSWFYYREGQVDKVGRPVLTSLLLIFPSNPRVPPVARDPVVVLNTLSRLQELDLQEFNVGEVKEHLLREWKMSPLSSDEGWIEWIRRLSKDDLDFFKKILSSVLNKQPSFASKASESFFSDIYRAFLFTIPLNLLNRLVISSECHFPSDDAHETVSRVVDTSIVTLPKSVIIDTADRRVKGFKKSQLAEVLVDLLLSDERWFTMTYADRMGYIHDAINDMLEIRKPYSENDIHDVPGEILASAERIQVFVKMMKSCKGEVSSFSSQNE